MRRFLASAAVCLLVSGPAVAESVAEKTGANALIGASPSTQDFVTDVAIADMFEIQSSKLAEQKKDVKADAFSKRMITDHTAIGNGLKSLVDSGKVKATLPTGLDSSHQGMLDKLKGLNGDAFERQFRSDMIAGHKGAVSLFKRYAAGGENRDLKAFAAQTLPIIEQHLTLAEGLAK